MLGSHFLLRERGNYINHRCSSTSHQPELLVSKSYLQIMFFFALLKCKKAMSRNIDHTDWKPAMLSTKETMVMRRQNSAALPTLFVGSRCRRRVRKAGKPCRTKPLTSIRYFFFFSSSIVPVSPFRYSSEPDGSWQPPCAVKIDESDSTSLEVRRPSKSS